MECIWTSQHLLKLRCGLTSKCWEIFATNAHIRWGESAVWPLKLSKIHPADIPERGGSEEEDLDLQCLFKFILLKHRYRRRIHAHVKPFDLCVLWGGSCRKWTWGVNEFLPWFSSASSIEMGEGEGMDIGGLVMLILFPSFVLRVFPIFFLELFQFFELISGYRNIMISQSRINPISCNLKHHKNLFS